MSEKRTDADKITLGSGKIYAVAFDGTPDIEKIKSICIAANELGYIKGGATVEYKGTFYDVTDDFGRVAKEVLTDEEATMKLGLITFNGSVLADLVSTAKVEESNGIRTVDIGGADNYQDKSKLIVFHHEDKTDGDIWVALYGANTAGVSLAFAKDKESTIEPEIKAKPMDSTGLLIRYFEEIGETSNDNAETEEEPEEPSNNENEGTEEITNG